MPIPAGHARYVLIGTDPGGETFETGWWMTSTIASEAAALAAATAARTILQSDPRNGLRALMPSTSVINSIRVYGYDGATTASFIAQVDGASIGVSSGPAFHPLQTCMVLTTLTGAAGRRNRGRMYWPAAGAAILGVTHNIDSTVAANAVTDIASFFSDLNLSVVGGGHVVVLSQVAGTSKRVTAIRGDTKPDIQRRRANKLIVSFSDTIALT